MNNSKDKKFKRTEIGMIPSDWELGYIADLFLKARIGWQGLTTNEYQIHGDCLLVTGTDFKKGKIDWKRCVFVDKWRYEQDKNIQLRNNDILVTKDGTIGKVAIVENLYKVATLNSGIFVLRTINKNVDEKYLYYVLLSKYFIKFIDDLSVGSSISHLYQKDFNNFIFAKPPKLEQEKIANALTRVDNLIEDYEKLIKKKEKIKKGLIQNLLTGKVKLKGFDTIYKTDSLGNICEIKKGKQINGNILLNKGKYYMLNGGQEPSGYLNEYNTLENTISISEGGNSCGYVNNNKEKFWAGGHLYVVDRFKTKMDTLYFYYLLKHNESSIMQLRKGSGLPNIQKSDLMNFEIYLTDDIKEQVAISQVLLNADNEINDLKIKLNKIINIKKGMLDNLLTGKIRL